MAVRGIRGAITVKRNTSEEILQATTELLQQVIKVNEVLVEDIVSVFFTVTPDVNAEFPAVAARQMGWNMVPLMCLNEMMVPGSLPLCIRVLIQINTTKRQNEIKYVYLREARNLRPDIVGREDFEP